MRAGEPIGVVSAGALALLAAVAGAAPLATPPRSSQGSLPPAVAAAAAPSGWADLEPATADRELLARVIAETGVATGRAEPGALERFGAWVRRSLGRLLDRLMPSLPAVGMGARGAVWLALALAAAAVAVGLAALLRAPRRRLRGRRRAPAEPDGADREAPPAVDAAGWRAELERRLAEGSVAGALEALWWWLARSVAGAEADPSWTGRELVRRARRPDLGRPVARLDAMTYGPERPAPAAVRELAAALDRALAGEPVGAAR